ncbi:MAG: 8-amino-7-oxononanoate synthase [Bacteroides sp.]|nr:8-amino-7-oxononanoate synthase [Bacteroides sp.]
MKAIEYMQQELQTLEADSNLRRLPHLVHDGRTVLADGRRMLNLSSNDYLGLATDRRLREEFLQTMTPDTFLPTSSSSRLLTGNFGIYEELETELSIQFGTEAALVFNSGYHANTGILPAVSDAQTLILADKLVHASIIDGIRLSAARCIRFRHNDLAQLERLLKQYHAAYRQLIVVTESLFSMDGDQADLQALVDLKKRYTNVLLYVDEAHAFGVRGVRGLGCAEEAGCIQDIDFLVGTFGKAAASAGAYLVCCRTIREYLVNRMRTLIFTTALPPTNIAWTLFVVRRLAGMQERRGHLATISRMLREAMQAKGYPCPSVSHIVPLIVGPSADAILRAEMLQRHGFYALPVRPPTVPEGTSRIRFSLTADIQEREIETIIQYL